MTVGLMTCYDLRFPELGRELADAGAELVLACSSWVPGEGKADHWRVLAQARAIENSYYVGGGLPGAARVDRAEPAGGPDRAASSASWGFRRTSALSTSTRRRCEPRASATPRCRTAAYVVVSRGSPRVRCRRLSKTQEIPRPLIVSCRVVRYGGISCVFGAGEWADARHRDHRAGRSASGRLRAPHGCRAQEDRRRHLHRRVRPRAGAGAAGGARRRGPCSRSAARWTRRSLSSAPMCRYSPDPASCSPS